MKKIISLLLNVTFCLTAFLPVCVIVSTCFGYRTELLSYNGFAIILASVSLITLILDLSFKFKTENKREVILIAVLPLVSLINGFFYAWYIQNELAFICIIVSIVCCCIAAIKHGKPLVLKCIMVCTAVSLIIPLLCFNLFMFFMADFGQVTVVRSIDSPNGNYCARVIDSDQGALGGDTLVYVYRNRNIDLYLIRFEKRPQTVYVGEWGEYEDIDVYWKDNRHLIINSSEYKIRRRIL